MRYHRDNKKRGFRQQFGRLVAWGTFFFVVTSVETRETENFHIDELAEDLIPPVNPLFHGPQSGSDSLNTRDSQGQASTMLGGKRP